MKKLTVLAVFCLFSLLGPLLEAHSPHDVVRAAAISPAYSSDRTVFCSLEHINTYILRSTDGGESWYPSMVGFSAATVTTIILSPAFVQDGIAFVGTREGEIFKSVDGGVHWKSSSTGLPPSEIMTIAVSPSYSTDQTLFAGTAGSGIFKSTDGGTTWSASNTGLSNLWVWDLKISPQYAADHTLFVGTSNGLAKSQDRGDSWYNPITGGALGFLISTISLSPDFASDQTLFVGTWGFGVFKSIDGGLGWVNANKGITELNITAVSLSPDFPTDKIALAATAKQGVFKSTDAGTLWWKINDGIDIQASQAKIHYFDFYFSPNFSNDREVFLTAWEGLHKARSDVTSWRHLKVFNQNVIRSMTISPEFETDGTIFAGAYAGGVYRSQSRGESWEAVATGLTGIYVAGMAISPQYATDQTVFCSSSEGIEKSINKGSKWILNRVEPHDFIYIRSMGVSPDFANDGIVLALNGSKGIHGLYKSSDGGETYSPVLYSFARGHSLAFSPNIAEDKTIFAASSYGIYRSTDKGDSWSLISPATFVNTVAISPNYKDDKTVFAATLSYGLFKSYNRGVNWIPVPIGPDRIIIQDIAFSPNYGVDQIVFAATKSHGLFKSTDGGINWKYTALEGTFMRKIAISPVFVTDHVLFLASWDGVYRSDNEGSTWSRVLDIQRWDDQSEFFLQFQGPWALLSDSRASASGLHHSNNALDKVYFEFNGDSIKWIGEKAPCGGIADVYVDDVWEAEIDLYSSRIEWQMELFSKIGLTPGAHRMTIIVSGLKNPLANDNHIFVDAFEVGY